MAILPQDEAAEIFIRMFEALARRSGKTLNPRSRADIARACELLSRAGQELDDLLDEIESQLALGKLKSVDLAHRLVCRMIRIR